MTPSNRSLAARPGVLALALALALPFASHATPAVETATLPAGTTSWQVPAGVTAINVVALGGGGGGGVGGQGGAGGQVTSTNWPVTPGTTLQVVIGSAGAGFVPPPEGDTPPEGFSFAALAGGATSLQNGAQWIVAGGGGSGGLNPSDVPAPDLSGGNGCGAPGMGPMVDEKSTGGYGGTGGQGGLAGANTPIPENAPTDFFMAGTAGLGGAGISAGGNGAIFTFPPVTVVAGSGGSGWGGGGGGGAVLENFPPVFGGGGGGGSTGGECVPGSNGGAPFIFDDEDGNTNTNTFAAKLVRAKAANATDGGAGSLTITYALPVSASLGGSISGLTAAGLVLESGGSPVQSVSPAANATSFAFADPAVGDYAVTVKTQPAGLQCTVSNGSGTISADVSNVAVSCVATPPAGGTTPTPVPSLGALGVLMLSGLLGWLGMRRRS